jgi:hypothetical protein
MISPHARFGNDALSHQVKNGVTPILKPVKAENEPTQLKRSRLKRVPPRYPRRAISPATPAQRAVIHGRTCIVTAGDSPCGGPIDPTHLIDRSITTVGQDDPRAVVPCCRHHHDLYDEGDLSLLEYLEPHFRTELAFAVERVGLLTTLRRVTNQRYVPEREVA